MRRTLLLACTVLLAVSLAGCSESLSPEVAGARAEAVASLTPHRGVFASAAQGSVFPAHENSVTKREFVADAAEFAVAIRSAALAECDKRLWVLGGELAAWSQAYDGWFMETPEANAAQLRILSTQVLAGMESIESQDFVQLYMPAEWETDHNCPPPP